MAVLAACGVACAQVSELAPDSHFVSQDYQLANLDFGQPIQIAEPQMVQPALAISIPQMIQPVSADAGQNPIFPAYFDAPAGPPPANPQPGTPPPAAPGAAAGPPPIYVLPPPPPPRWQYWLTISGGYSQAEFSSSPKLPYNHDGAYIDTNFYFPLPQLEAPVVGVGITWSGYWNTYSLGPPLYITENGNLNMFEFEGRLAWPLGARSGNGIYLLPRIGAGLLIDNYWLGEPYYGYTYSTYINYTGAAFEIRPDIEVGYRFGMMNIGAEVSYMAAWGGFGKLGDMAEEFRAGLIFGYRF